MVATYGSVVEMSFSLSSSEFLGDGNSDGQIKLRRAQRCFVGRGGCGYFPRNGPGFIELSELFKCHGVEDVE